MGGAEEALANYQASQPSQRIPDTNSMTWTVSTDSIVTIPFSTTNEASPATGTNNMGTNGPAMCSVNGTQTITVTDSNGNIIAFLDLKNGNGLETPTGAGSTGTSAIPVSVSYEGLSTAFNGSFNNSGYRGTLSYANSLSGHSNQNVTGSAVESSPSGTAVQNGVQSLDYSGTFSFYAPQGTYTIALNGGTTITPGMTIEGEGGPSDVGAVFSAGVAFNLAAQTPTNTAVVSAPTGSISVNHGDEGAGGVTLTWTITPPQ